MRQKIIITVAAILLSMQFFAAASYAAVYTTKEAAGAHDTVYVSGNPDMFPFEYYDSDAEAYRGVIPEMLKRISRKTGIDFTYVSAGMENRQHGAAKNKQVEILSCYITKRNTEQYIKNKIDITLLDGGTDTDIYLAFTEIADDELISTLKAEIGGFTDSELLSMIVRESKGTRNYKMPQSYRMAIFLILEMAVLAVIIYSIMRAERKKRAKAEKNMDATSGIGNRAYFKESYEQYINENIRNIYYIAYISFDLKLVNSYYGEAAGDETIRKAAEIIIKNLRENEFAARLYGGTFGLCFTANNGVEAGRFIESLLDFLNELEKKDGISEKGRFRAGIYSLENKDWSMEHAIYCADNAYKHAKANSLSYFLSTTEMEQAAEKSIKINSGITTAIEKKEFLPYVQFIASSKTGEIKGAEMLSRWKHPTEGLLNPYRYIETMERLGSIVDLDYYIFENACRQLDEWHGVKNCDFFVICNLTKLTLSEKDFPDKIRAIIKKYSFKREKLVVGIVEDMREHPGEIVSDNVGVCRGLGFQIALDNIGYGVSSLSDICELKADIMRISRERIGKTGGESCFKLVKALTTMGHSLGMEVLLEGIDNDIQAEMATETGCDYILGSAYSAQLPKKEIDNFIAEYEAPGKKKGDARADKSGRRGQITREE